MISLAPVYLAASTACSLASLPLSEWSSTAGHVASFVAGLALLAFVLSAFDLSDSDDTDPLERLRALRVSLGADASGDLSTYADSVRRARSSMGAGSGHVPMLPVSKDGGGAK